MSQGDGLPTDLGRAIETLSKCAWALLLFLMVFRNVTTYKEKGVFFFSYTFTRVVAFACNIEFTDLRHNSRRYVFICRAIPIRRGPIIYRRGLVFG